MDEFINDFFSRQIKVTFDKVNKIEKVSIFSIYQTWLEGFLTKNKMEILKY